MASAASLRWTLPGMTMRMGGAWAIMVRICTGRGVGAHEEAIARGARLLAGDEEGVLGVARGMVWGEV